MNLSVFSTVKLVLGHFSFTGGIIKPGPPWTCTQSNADRGWDLLGLVRRDLQLERSPE